MADRLTALADRLMELLTPGLPGVALHALQENVHAAARALDAEGLPKPDPLPEFVERHQMVAFYRDVDAMGRWAAHEALPPHLRERQAEFEEMNHTQGEYITDDVVVVDAADPSAEGVTSWDPTADPEVLLGMELQMHRPVLDIDFPAALVRSSTPGHSHLYLDLLMAWPKYLALLEALADAGIIEKGYLEASRQRGYSAARLPWIIKPGTEPKGPDDGNHPF